MDDENSLPPLTSWDDYDRNQGIANTHIDLEDDFSRFGDGEDEYKPIAVEKPKSFADRFRNLLRKAEPSGRGEEVSHTGEKKYAPPQQSQRLSPQWWKK